MTNWTSTLWCENVHRIHIIPVSLVFEYVQLKCVRIYYKLSWKYVNTAKIISRVTITLSLINSNKDFDFVGWVIKTPCVFYFRSVKFHYVKETHDSNSLLTLVKIAGSSIPAQKTIKQIFVKICWQLKICWQFKICLQLRTPTRTWKCTRCNYANELPVLAFQKVLQTRQTSRNNKKLCKKGFWLWLIIL